MNTRFVKAALLSVIAGGAAVAVSTDAVAYPVTEPGETIGLALGAALPEGVYFVDTLSYESPAGSAGSPVSAVVNIPVVAWSTPWTFLGGRVEAYAALPEVAASTSGPANPANSWSGANFYNPALLVGEAWALGGGFHFSNFVGGYAPIKTGGFGTDAWVFNERAALTYLNGGWDLTAHLIYGIVGDSLASGASGHRAGPDYVNVDLTAVKTIGKWEIGPVAYYTTDTSNNSDTGGFQTNEFALGGMAGYNFPAVSLHLIVTHDITAQNLGNVWGGNGDVKMTTGFVRLVAPLY